MKLYLLKSPLIWMIFQNRNRNIASVFALICAQVNVRGLDIVYKFIQKSINQEMKSEHVVGFKLGNYFTALVENSREKQTNVTKCFTEMQSNKI